MSDPQNFGLGELGQRVQAMSDPAPEPRLRPYQGGSQPSASAPTAASTPNPSTNGRPASIFDHFEEIRASFASSAPSSPPAQTGNQFNNYNAPPAPAPAEPFVPLDGRAASTNGAAPSAAAAPALPPAPEDPNAPKSGLQRAVNAVRSAIPLVQRLLPLLEGNVATAITALMAPQQVHHHPAPPPVQVDLEPVERGLAELRTGQRDLRTQVQEQTGNLKRVEDQLDRVREATDRNTLEQQELVEDLRAVGSRISTFAVVGLILLLVSLGLNIYFLVQLQHILR